MPLNIYQCVQSEFSSFYLSCPFAGQHCGGRFLEGSETDWFILANQAKKN